MQLRKLSHFCSAFSRRHVLPHLGTKCHGASHICFKIKQKLHLIQKQKNTSKLIRKTHKNETEKHQHQGKKRRLNSLSASYHFSHLLITFANSLDPDHAQQNVGPDLDPNCLTPEIIFFKKKRISRQQKKHTKLSSM